MKTNHFLISLGLIVLTPWLVLAANTDRINVAAAANGGTASASSTEGDNYTPDALIDGDRRGLNLTSGGAWRDATPGEFPDWVEIKFDGVMSVDEIDVFTQQDTWWSPEEPTETLLFFNNGITNFELQFWSGTTWTTLPGCVVTNNSNVWRRLTFPSVTTDKIRLLINGARATVSTVVELEAYGVPVSPPDPDPTPTPPPPPPFADLQSELAKREIYFDNANNIGFGTFNPVFNDDGTTGALVGKWVAIDGRLTDAAAYLGIGGNIPTPGNRVGVLSFYNMAMGGADHRTAAIYSFNGTQLGTGTLEFYTAPDFIGPVRRMQIAPTGEVGINHAAAAGTVVSIMGKSTGTSDKSLVVLDAVDRSLLTVRDDGQISVGRPGQGIVLRSPNGQVCRKLVIDDTGALVVQPMASCPN